MGKYTLLRIAWVMGLALASATVLPAQEAAKSENNQANIQAYIDLLRANVKSEKAQILAVMLQFSPDQAAIFWPIYQVYDAELTKLSDRKIAAINDWAEHYDSLTDERADQIVQELFAIQTARDAALKNCYDQVKAKLGAKEAARFLQIEHQLLLIIDLQIASSLPAVK